MTVQRNEVPVPQVEERVEALSRRFMELSDRVRAAASGSSGANLTEVLQEFAATVLELEVSAEEIRAQDESLAHAQAQLDAEVTRYHELFDLAPDGYLVTDTNGVIVESNRAASELLGCPARVLHRKPAIVFVDGAHRRTVLHRLHDAVSGSTNRVVTFEARFAPPNGRSFPASVNLTASRSGHSGAVSVRWLIRDEGRRVDAERALVESEARYRLLADSSSDVVITTDGSGCIDYASPSTLAVLAHTPRELEGHTVASLVHPDDRAVLETLQVAALEEHRSASVVCRFRRANHGFLPMEAAVVPLAGSAPGSLGLRYALRDVREREASRLAMREALALEQRAAATLREADASKNALLLAASHDLTTPVAAVAALAEILHRHPDLPQGEVARIAEGLVTTSSRIARHPLQPARRGAHPGRVRRRASHAHGSHGARRGTGPEPRLGRGAPDAPHHPGRRRPRRRPDGPHRRQPPGQRDPPHAGRHRPVRRDRRRRGRPRADGGRPGTWRARRGQGVCVRGLRTPRRSRNERARTRALHRAALRRAPGRPSVGRGCAGWRCGLQGGVLLPARTARPTTERRRTTRRDGPVGPPPIRRAWAPWAGPSARSPTMLR